MDENAGPGRNTHTLKLQALWGGIFRDMGDAEVLVEEGKIVKVLSFTPETFEAVHSADLGTGNGEAL